MAPVKKFWNMKLKANREYIYTPLKVIHLTGAVLDYHSSQGSWNQLYVTYKKYKCLLCTLQKGRCDQAVLNLYFSVGDEIHFQIEGDGNITLFGCSIGHEEDKEADEIDRYKTKQSKEEVLVEKTKMPPVKKYKHDSKNDRNDINDTVENEAKTNPKRKKRVVKKQESNVLNVKHETKDILTNQRGKQKKQLNNNSQENAQQERILSDGLRIVDICIGNGPEAKHGRRCKIYYEGRLLSNNKVFDSMKFGQGYKFILGQDTFIKGWGIGIVGMKVGGKRRITCPPHMAYGDCGLPPLIPPNSTLIYDVELKSVA